MVKSAGCETYLEQGMVTASAVAHQNLYPPVGRKGEDPTSALLWTSYQTSVLYHTIASWPNDILFVRKEIHEVGQQSYFSGSRTLWGIDRYSPRVNAPKSAGSNNSRVD
jgi:hypothetical protein